MLFVYPIPLKIIKLMLNHVEKSNKEGNEAIISFFVTHTTLDKANVSSNNLNVTCKELLTKHLSFFKQMNHSINLL